MSSWRTAAGVEDKREYNQDTAELRLKAGACEAGVVGFCHFLPKICVQSGAGDGRKVAGRRG